MFRAGNSYGNKTIDLSHNHTSAAHTHGVNGHTHTTGSLALTIAQMPLHSHDLRRTFGSGQISSDGGAEGKLFAGNINNGWDQSSMKYSGNSGGNATHNHGNTGSTSLTTNSTTPNNTGNSLSSAVDITPLSKAVFCWRRTS